MWAHNTELWGTCILALAWGLVFKGMSKVWEDKVEYRTSLFYSVASSSSSSFHPLDSLLHYCSDFHSYHYRIHSSEFFLVDDSFSAAASAATAAGAERMCGGLRLQLR